MQPTIGLIFLASLAMWASGWAYRRIELSRAKHRSLAGHARWARRIAAWLPNYEYDDTEFFNADAAPEDIVERRRSGFAALSEHYARSFSKTTALTREVDEAISDLQFISRYRVPFQFSRHVRRHLQVGAFLDSSKGIEVRDLDGNQLIDLSGSYGVNTFGYDFYKECIEKGAARVRI